MKRNKFNLSHYKIGSCDMGKLYPISCYEVLPGDTIRQGTSVFLRLAPTLSPVLHRIVVSTYSFYVPMRLLWNNTEDFLTGGPDGLDVSVPPTVSFPNGVAVHTLPDYLGVPLGFTGEHSLLPYRAYYKIWNDYFRDQDLYTPNTDNNNGQAIFTDTDYNGVADGASTSGYSVFRVSWEKDYFTTARPFPQKGVEVNVPVNSPTGGISLSATGNPIFKVASGTIAPDSSTTSGIHNVEAHRPDGTQGSNNIQLYAKTQQGTVVNNSVLQWDNPNLNINVASGNLGNVKLNDLREAFALQRFEEARAMYGSRYTEYLRYLGIRSSDARLQRPEYLGGSRNTIQISEVLQTAADGSTPVGTLRGHGIGATRNRPFRRFIEEHGFVMTLMAIRPIAVYSQGLNRMWSRTVKEDYWERELQHIGQQEVLTKELYAIGDNPDSVFGYQNRYDEYRSVPSTVSGEMRTTLDYWHLARVFDSEPVLNQAFITGSPTKRVFAEQTQDEIYFLASNSVVARRLLSKTGNPIL